MKSNNKTILVVDDDDVLRAMLVEVLRASDFTVIEASSGDDAIKLLSSIEDPENFVHLALLDYEMPGLNGVETAATLIENYHIPFMMITSYYEDERILAADKLGAIGYLVKPLNASSIVPQVMIALGRIKTITGLHGALLQNVHINQAVGIIMSRSNLDNTTAFEQLRSYARSHRQRIEVVAKEIVLGANRIAEIGNASKGK